MSVRLRLTLWYTALLTVFLTGFATLVYLAVDHQLASDLDHAVELRAVEVAQSLMTARVSRTLGPTEPLRIPAGSTLTDREHYVQLLSPRGDVLARSEGLAEPIPVSRPTMQIMLDGQVTRDALTLSSGERVALYGTPVLLDETVVGAILVAAPTGPIEETLSQLRMILMMAVLGSVVLAGGVGWLLASAAMRPVAAITEAARSIGRSGDLSGRLPAPRRCDELGRLSIAFNELLERLDVALATQRRFLADASHELRTPLTTIRATAGALLRSAQAHHDGPGHLAREGDADQDDSTRGLRSISDESERMGRLVTDLLALARADAGQPLERRPLMLDALLIDVYQQARFRADHLTLTIGDLEQIELNGDPDRLRQLLLNLVDNACRYTPAGGTVTLALVARDDWARLMVRDTGVGIAAPELPRIFERFYRADHARSREAGGTGLGLAISRVIAEAHGGRIDVESQPGLGSTFTVLLPLPPTIAAGGAEVGAPGVLTSL